MKSTEAVVARLCVVLGETVFLAGKIAVIASETSEAGVSKRATTWGKAHKVVDGSGTRLFVLGDLGDDLRLLARFLEGHNVQVITATWLDSRSLQFRKTDSDLVLLCPERRWDGGFGLLREIRAQSNRPVIMLGKHDDVADRVAALELGADDYIAKPCRPRELHARIEAVLRRRAGRFARLSVDSGDSVYHFGGWQLNQHKRCLTRPDGAREKLSKQQYALLAALIAARGSCLSRAQMGAAISPDGNVSQERIYVVILRLRRKLEDGSRPSAMIQTVYGVGYRLLPTVRLLRAGEHLEEGL